MAQVTFSIHMDENLKQQFDALCADFGMNVTTAFTLFVKTVVRDREIPFKIAASDPFYSGANLRHIEKSLAEWNNPDVPKIVKTMEELEAMADE
jgi:DNA-damage-inducible protein J